WRRGGARAPSLPTPAAPGRERGIEHGQPHDLGHHGVRRVRARRRRPGIVVGGARASDPAGRGGQLRRGRGTAEVGRASARGLAHGAVMLVERIDGSVAYDGPRARLATLTGSPVWGLGDGFASFAARLGHRLLGVHRPMTPYGLGPQVESYSAPGGAAFIRIPSYGMVWGEDWSLRAAEWRVFGILGRAGVEVRRGGGPSGTADGGDREDGVRPGDLALPWSYLSLDAVPSGLPGTELENVLAERVALMDEPFCPAL